RLSDPRRGRLDGGRVAPGLSSYRLVGRTGLADAADAGRHRSGQLPAQPAAAHGALALSIALAGSGFRPRALADVVAAAALDGATAADRPPARCTASGRRAGVAAGGGDIGATARSPWIQGVCRPAPGPVQGARHDGWLGALARGMPAGRFAMAVPRLVRKAAC